MNKCGYYLSQRDGPNPDNRCILFKRDAMENMTLIDSRELKKEYASFIPDNWYFGTQRDEPTKYYLGSMASATPTQRQNCMNTDYDLIYNSSQQIVFNVDDNNAKQMNQRPSVVFGMWITLMGDITEFLVGIMMMHKYIHVNIITHFVICRLILMPLLAIGDIWILENCWMICMQFMA